MTNLVLVFVFIAEFWTAHHVIALSLSPRGTDNTLEVIENKGDNLFTCSGLTSSDDASWRLLVPGGDPSEYGLGACSPSSCYNDIPDALRLGRPTVGQSTLTVNTTNTVYNFFFQGTSIVCRTGTQTNQQGASCQVDLVAVPATKSCNVRYNTGTSASWTVTANCSFTGVYSYRNRSKCRLVQTSPTQQNVGSEVTYTPTGSNKYKSGSCEVTAPFPSTTNSYSYQMVIVPGRVEVTANFEGGSSSFQISRPSSAPTHTCAEYVEEGTSVTCTCSSADLGQPAGIVKWSSSETTQLSLSNINRTQHGSQHVCEVVWNGQRVQSVTYTLRVAYGPSSATVTTSPSLPFDTNGSQEMTITCSAQDANPTPTFTWLQKPSNNVIVQGHSVKFTPQVPGDDNSVFQCRVQNPKTSTSQSASVTVGLNYPPNTNPTITNTSTPSSSGGHLYEGDRVTLTCDVTGGKPINATTLTFTCSSNQQGQTDVGSTEVSSRVTFNSLDDSDHDKVCTCTTKWKQTNWYNRNVAVTLFVNTPPSTPEIVPPSTEYPPIATVTTSVTFTCRSSTSGRPAATYTWPQTQGGTDTQAGGMLTFDTITKELNGKVISCKASNLYTENRNPVTDGTWTMEVYYHPDVSVRLATDTTANQCDPLPSDPTQCVVTEGQRVHLQCTARSNPDPANFMWSPGHETGPDLSIQSANRTQHTGLYNCSVETGPGRQGDTRLPLRGSGAFTVLVAYPASISSFTSDSANTSVTVGVNDIVTLTCRAEGRPSPRMTLSRPNGVSINSVGQGTPSLSDEPKEVTGKVTAQCPDTGLYTCDIDNGVGMSQQRQVSVFVQCGPEKAADNKDTVPAVNFRTGAEHFAVDVTAYPTPRLTSIKRFPQQPNATSVGQTASQNTVAVMCLPASVTSSNVTCQVTVDNMTSSDAGFYQAVIGNGFGNLTITFQVKINATSLSSEDDFPVAAVVVGIVAALIVIAVFGAGLFLWKRRKALKDKENPPLRNRQNGRQCTEEPEMIVNSIYGMPENGNRDDEDETMIVNTMYESSGAVAPRAGKAAQQGSAYEDVDVDNAGPAISPRSQVQGPAADSPGAEAVYSVVRKENKPTPAPATSSGNTSEVYATVDKTKKKHAVPPPAAADTSANNKPKPVAKPKPAQKKPSQKTKETGKGKKKDQKGGKQSQNAGEETPEGAEYGNMALLATRSVPNKGTEYENYGFDEDDGSHDDKQASGGQPEGRSVNADGLVYTTVAFSDEQQKAAKKPGPKRDSTPYAAVDFKGIAPPPPPPAD